jgi:hypothetical protein
MHANKQNPIDQKLVLEIFAQQLDLKIFVQEILCAPKQQELFLNQWTFQTL